MAQRHVQRTTGRTASARVRSFRRRRLMSHDCRSDFRVAVCLRLFGGSATAMFSAEHSANGKAMRRTCVELARKGPRPIEVKQLCNWRAAEAGNSNSDAGDRDAMLAQPDVIGVFHMPLLGGSVLGIALGLPHLRCVSRCPGSHDCGNLARRRNQLSRDRKGSTRVGRCTAERATFSL